MIKRKSTFFHIYVYEISAITYISPISKLVMFLIKTLFILERIIKIVSKVSKLQVVLV